MVISLEAVHAIHPDLKKTAKKIEESELGTRVLGANYLYLHSYVIEMSIQVQQPKKLNILEEFVLKALLQFDPPPTPAELSRIFGLDVLFINDVLHNLALANIIKNENADCFTFTDVGKRYFRDGYYPTEKTVSGVQFVYIVPLSTLLWIPKIPDHLSSYFQRIDPLVQDPALERISLKNAIDALVEDGSGIHNPEVGHRVTAINDIRPVRTGQLPFPAYLLLDKFKFSKMEDDNLSVRFVNPIKNQRDFTLEDQQTDLLEKLKIEIKDIFPAVFEDAVDVALQPEQIDVLPEYKKAVLEQYKIEQAEKEKRSQPEIPSRATVGQDHETIEFLFAENIRTRWIQALREAKNIVTILTPWVNEEVVDDEMLEDFRKLAQRRILINIGWGFSPTIEKEEKPIKESLSRKLNRIRTPDDLPAINVFYIGNMHNKDFVADRRIHISGSHNYLSYRGDRHPRAESAYYVINRTAVREALKQFDELFDKAISRTWDEKARMVNQDGLIRCCVAWTCIYRPKVALREIHNLTLKETYSNDGLLMEKLFKGVFKSLVQLPMNEESKALINQVVEPMEMYGPRAAFIAKTNGHYIQDWVNYLCRNSETKQIIRAQKGFLRKFDLVVPDKL